jgi:glutathione S-transferase
VQSILWRVIENEIEGIAFKLNDVYYEEFLPLRERLPFLRHKERKFGRGCIAQWRDQAERMLAELEHRLLAYDAMLTSHPFLLDDQPRFVDFDLYGMLANLLFTGHYELPAACSRLREWYPRLTQLTRTAR